MMRKAKCKVIALVSTKGGVGKSTLTCSLAAELMNRWPPGAPVWTLVDADPQGGTAAWHGAGGPLGKLMLIREPTEKIREVVQGLTSRSHVIIDAAGAATRTMVTVLELADLVLIPCRPSSLDALGALATLEMVNMVSNAKPRPTRSLVILNATTRTSMTKHIRAELENAGAPVAQSEIANRAAFAAAAINGSAPCWMGAPARAAAADIGTLTDEIMGALRR
jgi:chromosome partitioning protein